MSALNFVTKITGNADQELAKLQKGFADLEKAAEKHDFTKTFEKRFRDLAAKLQSDLDTIRKAIAGTDAALADLTKKKESAAAAGNTEEEKKLSEQISLIKKKSDAYRDTLKKLEAFKDGMNELGTAYDKAAQSGQKATGGSNKLLTVVKNIATGGLKSLKAGIMSIASIGIIGLISAITTGLAALFRHLKSTEQGAKAMAKITGTLKGLFATLKPAMDQLGKAMFDAFNKVQPLLEFLVKRIGALFSGVSHLIQALAAAASGEWKSAWESIKNVGNDVLTAITGKTYGANKALIDTNKNVVKSFQEVEEANHQLEKEREDFVNEEKKLNQEIAKAEASGNNTKAAKLRNQIQEKHIDLKERELALAKQEDALNGRTEASDKTKALEGELTDLQTEQIKSNSRADKQANNIAEKRKELADKEAEQIKEQGELAASLTLEAKALEIAAMKEGFAKERAEMDNEHQQRKDTINKQYDERLKQIQHQRKEEYKLSHNGSTAGFTMSVNDPLAVQNEANRRSALQNEDLRYNTAINKQMQQLQDERLQSLTDYLQAYGTLEEREWAITEEYNKKIEDALREGNKNKADLLKRQRDDALAGAGTDYYKEFGTLEQQYSAMLAEWENRINNLPTELQEGARKVMDDSLASLIEAYIESGDDLDLTAWAAKVSNMSLKQLDKEMKRLAKQLTSGDIDVTSDEYTRILAQMDLVQKKSDKARKAVSKQSVSWESLMPVLNDAASAFSELGEMIGGAAGEMLSIGGSFMTSSIQIANGINKIGEAASALEKANAILAVISAVIKVISKVISINKANQEANEAAAQAAYDYAKALEQVRIAAERAKHANAFGTDDLKLLSTYTAQAEQSIKNINDVLSNSRAFNPSNIWEQRLFGITSDGRSGWQKFWGSNKNQKTLTEADYMTDGVFDGERLRAWYDTYGKNLSKENKRIIEGLLADWDNYQDAIEESTRYISELLNDVADDVAESLVDSFIESGNALADLTDLSNDFAKSMAVAAVKSKLMSEVFTDEALQEISGLIENDSEGAIRKYNELLEQANGMSGAINAFLQGINLEELASMYQQNPQAGAFQTMSQDTATELNGRFTALQLAGEIIKDNSDTGVGMLASINALSASNNALLAEIHTFHMLETGYLEDISKHTKPLLEFGDKLDQIVTNTDRL